MTISIEQQIDELRAELREIIDPVERRQIAQELETALAQREVMLAEAEGRCSSEPPF